MFFDQFSCVSAAGGEYVKRTIVLRSSQCVNLVDRGVSDAGERGFRSAAEVESDTERCAHDRIRPRLDLACLLEFVRLLVAEEADHASGEFGGLYLGEFRFTVEHFVEDELAYGIGIEFT